MSPPPPTEMTESLQPECLVTVEASGSIVDPDLTLERPAEGELRPVDVDTRLDLFGGRIVLFFSGRRFVPFLPKPHEQFPYYPLVYFLIYRSRVHYNIVFPDWLAAPPAITPAPAVVFSISRLVKVEREATIAGKTRLFWHYETEPHPITVTTQEFEDLLRLCTPQLYFSLAYFLIGCENTRYFLIEFYKAIEVIENALGGERAAISVLAPYGLVGTEFKRLKRYANEQRRPFDIGRHAPRGSDLRAIDARRLLEEPLSHQIFRESVAVARQAIDAYFAHLRTEDSRDSST